MMKEIAAQHGRCNDGDGLWQALSACIVVLLIRNAQLQYCGSIAEKKLAI